MPSVGVVIPESIDLVCIAMPSAFVESKRSQKLKWRRKTMLFCLTANYTPKGLEAMGKNVKTNRREAVEKLVNAAGGKLVAMYGTIAEGPGAMAIFDVEATAAPAVIGVAASSDGLRNVKMQRLYSADEMTAIRQKRVDLQASYNAPGH